jgi:acetyltransferase-like isoleucine patch superfamily enzyme
MINKLAIYKRKILSGLSRFSDYLCTWNTYTYIFFNSSLKVGASCSFGRSIKLRATDGGVIIIGDYVNIADNVHIIARGGCIIIESGTFIGTGTIIVSQENITIQRDTLIAEYVVIRDQDHRTDSKPLATSGFYTDAIVIGRDVWIGCKATILRGTVIEDGCVIGAHALVNSHIPSGMLAVGLPARITKKVN